MAESAIEPLEEMGYEVEIVMFDDRSTPMSLLMKVRSMLISISISLFHDTYNEENGTDIVMLAPSLSLLWHFFRALHFLLMI